jgi:AraC-like DNA-binding protein
MYAERRSPVVPAVLWKSTRASEGLVLPDGCMDLIWFGDSLLVAGPDTRPHIAAPSRGTEVVGLRFLPGVGPHVLGVPAVELRDRRVPLDSIWRGSEVRRLTDRLAQTPRVAWVLETLARERLRQGTAVPPDLASLVTMVGRGMRVSEIAERLGVSERQLHRRSLAAFGYGPKVLGRILRFIRASELLREGVSRAEAAAVTGYADQPHMRREFRALMAAPTGQATASVA